jgi:hypothetical protein
MAHLGMGKWIFLVSLLAFSGLGFWTYIHRSVDLWLILGVTAILARFWTYHRWYDDLLIVLPMVALFRIAKNEANAQGHGVLAAVLLGITLLFMLAPGGLYLLPKPWNIIYTKIQIGIWIILLVFLLYKAWHQHILLGREPKRME